MVLALELHFLFSGPNLMISYYTFLLFATSKIVSMGMGEKLYFLFWGGVQNLVSPKASVSRMSLHRRGEYISDQIRRTKRHYELANLVKVSLLSKISYFVDVGANIGNHSHFFGFKGGVGVGVRAVKGKLRVIDKELPVS